MRDTEGMDKESIAVANNPMFPQIMRRSGARHAAKGGVPLARV